jgi:hypothetical protein
MTITTTSETNFCSVCARQAGLDPSGYAAAHDQVIAVEIPLPWPATMFSDPGTLPPELLEMINILRQEHMQGRPVRIRPLAIAPDPEYSRPSFRRALFYQRPNGSCAAFTQQEYLAPEAEIGMLCWALLRDPAMLPHFEVYREPTGAVRDLMVCTHGTIDAACGKFGFPLYNLLRERYAASSGGRLRAWRVTHFGGHVFAPTMIDMPHGSYWAYVGNEEAELLVQRGGDVTRLRDHYRGWSGLAAPFLQVLERELFLHYGWPWLNYHKQGKVLAEDQTGQTHYHQGHAATWAEVQIDFAAPDGSLRGSCIARVEESKRVETISSTGDPATYAYPQYAVAWMEIHEDQHGSRVAPTSCKSMQMAHMSVDSPQIRDNRAGDQQLSCG